jgi:hypothetical protein
MGCATLRVGRSGRITSVAAFASLSLLISRCFCLSAFSASSVSLAAVLPAVQSISRPRLLTPT